MTLEKEPEFVGISAKCSHAQLALQELKAADFSMHKVFVIAQNPEEQDDIAGVEVKEHTGNTSKQGSTPGCFRYS